MVYKGAIMEYIRYQYIISNIIIDIRYQQVAIKHFFFSFFFFPFHQDLNICCISAGAAVNCQPFQNGVLCWDVAIGSTLTLIDLLVKLP